MIKSKLQGAENLSAIVEKSTSMSGGTTNHAQLTNLAYEKSGHTGFASEASLTALEGQIPHDISQLNDDIGVATKSGVNWGFNRGHRKRHYRRRQRKFRYNSRHFYYGTARQRGK